MSPFLEVNEVTVSLGDLHILWNVSLSMEQGEVVAIIGSNGAGKTSLLHTISGLLRPTRGSIEFLGKRIDQLAPSEIVEIGLVQVPEGGHLFPDMTVLDNLALATYVPRARNGRQEKLQK